MITATMGSRIRERRKIHGLTQVELVDELEKMDTAIGRSYVSDLERTEKMPNGDVVAGLARVFGVSADWLLGLIGEPVPLTTRQRQIVVDATDWAEAETIREVVAKFRALPEDARRFVIEVMERELGR